MPALDELELAFIETLWVRVHPLEVHLNAGVHVQPRDFLGNRLAELLGGLGPRGGERAADLQHRRLLLRDLLSEFCQRIVGDIERGELLASLVAPGDRTVHVHREAAQLAEFLLALQQFLELLGVGDIQQLLTEVQCDIREQGADFPDALGKRRQLRVTALQLGLRLSKQVICSAGQRPLTQLLTTVDEGDGALQSGTDVAGVLQARDAGLEEFVLTRLRVNLVDDFKGSLQGLRLQCQLPAILRAGF